MIDQSRTGAYPSSPPSEPRAPQILHQEFDRKLLELRARQFVGVFRRVTELG